MEDELKKSQLSRMKKRYNFLKQAKLYLETNPNESFCKSELEKVMHRTNVVMGNFSMADLPINSALKRKIVKAYEKENGVDKMREQTRLLRFLTSN